MVVRARFVLLVLALGAGCVVDGGKRGEPIFDERPLQSFIQVHVTGTVVIDTANPDVKAPTYVYDALESFDVTALHVAAGVAGIEAGPARDSTSAGGVAYPYASQRDKAIARARADVLKRIGVCASLVDVTAEKLGELDRPRIAQVTTKTGTPITDQQLAGFCTGGVLP